MALDSISKKNVTAKVLFYTLILFTISLVQLSFFFLITIYGISPDFLILLTIWITLSEGRVFGLFSGFIIGLFFDFVSMNVLGVSALCKTTVAFIVGFFYKEKEFKSLLRDNKIFVIVLLATFAHNLLFYLIQLNIVDTNVGLNYVKMVVGSTIYTTLFSLLTFFFRIRRFW